MTAIRCILALFILLAASAARAETYVSVAPPASFRGLAWKTPLKQTQGLSPVPGEGYKNTFFRQDEDLHMGDARVLSVAYYFHKGLFYRVGILFEGQVNQYHLTRDLLKKYGRAMRYGSKLGWVWPAFSIQLDFDYATKRGALYYTYEGPLEP